MKKEKKEPHPTFIRMTEISIFNVAKTAPSYGEIHYAIKKKEAR